MAALCAWVMSMKIFAILISVFIIVSISRCA